MLVPVVLYVGAYVGCSRVPAGSPVLMGSGEVGRGVRELFKPILAIHETAVMGRARDRLDGKWVHPDGGGVEFQFVQSAEGDLIGWGTYPPSFSAMGAISWVVGTGMVGIEQPVVSNPWFVKFELVDGDRMRVYLNGKRAASGVELVRSE